MPMDRSHDLRYAKYENKVEEQLDKTGAAILIHDTTFRHGPSGYGRDTGVGPL